MWAARMAAVVALAAACGTSGAAAVLAEADEVRVLSDQVMEDVAAGDFEGGLRRLQPYLIVPRSEFEGLLATARRQLPLAARRFGRSVEAEFLREEAVGESFMRRIYLQRFERHATRWSFIFYRSPSGWVLNSFRFSDNIRDLFAD